MKMKKALYAIGFMVMAMLFFSCATKEAVVEEEVLPVEQETEPLPPPPSLGTIEPFTNTLFDGLKNKMPSFLLSEEIVLYKESYSNEVSLKGDGTIVIQDLDNNGRLIFEKNAKGKALRIEEKGDERLIYVSFLKEGGIQDENTLIFSSNKNSPSGQFFLKTANKNVLSLLDAEQSQSVITYGGVSYNVQYEGTSAPFLFVTVLRPEVINLGGETIFPSSANLP